MVSVDEVVSSFIIGFGFISGTLLILIGVVRIVLDCKRRSRMPFKSEAQRRKFGEMLKQGKISKATFDEWNSDTPHGLPERVKKKKK